MGLIRKTLSVGTCGVVSFRSKKERLRRAERSQHDAEASLIGEHAARVAAEGRVSGDVRVDKPRSGPVPDSLRDIRSRRDLGPG